MTRKPPIATDGAGRTDSHTEDGRTYTQRLIAELDGLDDPADERRFVEAVVRAAGINPAETILITPSADTDSSKPLSDRVLLPSTGELEQLETARRMLTYGDDRQDIALFRHEPPTQHSRAQTLQHSTESRWRRFRDRITALW